MFRVGRWVDFVMLKNLKFGEKGLGRPYFDVLGRMNLFSTKILLTMCGITMLTCVIIGGWYSKKVETLMLEREIARLSLEAQNIENAFLTSVDVLAGDVRILQQLPPIQGIIRSVQHGGIDPLDGSTLALWRERLETIFLSLLTPRSPYVQLRYIGVAEGGRELVRVNRHQQGDIEVVDQEDYQQKANESYFEGIQNRGVGDIYFSPVTLNREHGEVQVPYLPVLRAGMPVFDSASQLFGMLVVNVAFDKWVKDIVLRLKLDDSLYIMTDQEDYLIYHPDRLEQSFRFNYASLPSLDRPVLEVLQRINAHGGYEVIEVSGERFFVYYHRLFLSSHDPQRYLTFARVVSESSLLPAIKEIRFYGGVIAFVLIALAVVCAVFLSNMFKHSLKRMVKEIKTYDESGLAWENLVRRGDEIGELACAFQELTERLETMRDVEKETRGRLQAILDNTVDGLITINSQGVVLHYNAACEAIFGYPAQDVVGQNIKMLMPSSDRLKHDGYLKNYHETGERKIIGIGREVYGRRKDGSQFPLELSVSEVHVNQQILFSGIVRDITVRRAAEDEILRSNQELERFAYVASHDLQEPLRMLSNFSKLLSEECNGELSKEAKEYLVYMSSAVDRMQSLVCDLLEYSKIDRGNLDLVPVDTMQHTQMALDNLGQAIKESGAEITMDDLPTVYANPVRFLRLMQNLIGNAIKYRAEDRVCKIRVHVDSAPGHWTFSVQDNGIGIKDDYLKSIFLIFKRLHGKTEYPGTGLGLAISKKIVESFGGEIWAESRSGTGTTFYFTIPKKS